MSERFVIPETPAGTRVRESLGRKREGFLTGETRLNARTHYVQHLVDFDGPRAWATYLIIVAPTPDSRPDPSLYATGTVSLRLGGTRRDYAARICECHLRPEAMRPNGNGGQSWLPLTSAQAARVRWGHLPTAQTREPCPTVRAVESALGGFDV